MGTGAGQERTGASAGTSDASSREAVYEAFADPDLEVDERIETALEVGTDRLDLSLGFLTEIDDETQTITHVVGEHDRVREGTSCSLDRAYCEATVRTEGLLAVEDARDHASVSAEAYDTFDLGAYLGTKVRVGDGRVGTVCFADPDPRTVAFDEADRVFVEVLARQVEQCLERVALERELRERNEHLQSQMRRFEAIAENSFDVLFRIDQSGRFTYVSAAVERTLGYDPEGVVGDPVTDYLDGTSAISGRYAMEQVFDGEAVEGIRLAMADDDGERVVLEVNATPVHEGERVVGIQGVARDVTERLRRNRELRLKDRAMEGAQVGVTISSVTGSSTSITYANRAFTELTGYEAEAVRGRGFEVLAGPRTDPDTLDAIRSAIAEREPATVELLSYRRDGTQFWNEFRIDPVEDEGGTVTHVVGFHQDVTNQRRTDQLIRVINRVLRHNLRNEMNVLVGHASLLRDGDDPPEAVADQVEERAMSLVALGERARELERQARVEPDPGRLDPAELLGDVANRRGGEREEVTVEVDVRTDRDVVAGDEVGAALDELVSNSVDHAGGPVAVRLGATDADGWIRIDVVDDGPGVSDLEAEVVAEGAKGDLKHGTNLGLWLVNWIVTRYGGSFELEGEPDGEGGTRATMWLPSADPDEPVTSVRRGPSPLFE